MAKEGFIKRFMEKKPLLYSTLILALIAVVCGALLGFGNKFLYTERDNSGALGVIFNVLTGTKEHTVIFDKTTADEFTVGAEKIKIEKAKRDAANVEAAYKIENGGKTYILIMSMGTARNASDGPLKVITAYIADAAGKPENDKIAGSRPYDAPASEYRDAYNKKFFGSFSDKTAGTDIKLSDTDGYTGATKTATGLVEAVGNASAFYKLYRNSLMGVADSPFVKALKKAYKFAANADETAFTGLPQGITLYMTNDGLPVLDVAADGYNIILSFAEKHGLLGGAAVYGDGVTDELEAAAESAAGKDPADAGFAESLGTGAAVSDMAALIKPAYEFFDANRLDIFKKNPALSNNLTGLNGLTKISRKALSEPAGDYTFIPVLGLDNGTVSRNTVLYAKDKMNYYTAFSVLRADTGADTGLYVFLTSIDTFDSKVLIMTAINANEGTLGYVKEMLLYDCQYGDELALSNNAFYVSSEGYLNANYRGILGDITANSYKTNKNNRFTTDVFDDESKLAVDPHFEDNPTTTATVTINRLAENVVDAVDIYRILIG